MILRSSRLAVHVAEPGTAYRGSRFEWTGFVTRVELDGRHRFCVPESLRPGVGTGGLGLCSEFGLTVPLGYDEAAPGERFPKLGVGLLTRRDSGRYPHMHAHPLEPASIRQRRDAGGVTWTVEPQHLRGYAARLVKRLELDGDRLRIAYHLENVGSRRLVTNEYNHNFISIDERPIDAAMRMTVSTPLVAELSDPLVEQHATTISFTQRVPERTAFYCRYAVPAARDGFSWTLLHQPSGVGLSERVDFAPSFMALWGMAHVLSPEVFIGIDLAPGETLAWRREWTFLA